LFGKTQVAAWTGKARTNIRRSRAIANHTSIPGPGIIQGMKKLLLLSCLVSVAAFASPKTACVKNDLKGGTNTCEGGMGSKYWVYFYSASPDPMFEICARKRSASFCEMAGDNFVYAEAKPTKEKVCVQNFATSVSNLCDADPDHYEYILLEAPAYPL